MGWHKLKDKTKKIFHRNAATGSAETPDSSNVNTTSERAQSDSVCEILGTVSNTQPSSTNACITPNDQFPRDLWERSFQRLSPEEQQQLDAFKKQEQSTLSGKAQKSSSYVEDLIDITKERQKEWEDRRWVLKFDGHTIVPREYMENIVDCLTFAGDIGVNFLPQPADVVWPVIKGAMQAPITAEAEIGATLTVTDLLVRYISCGSAYEKSYLPKAKDQLKNRLESALEDMYLACLKLICVALKNLRRNTASRVARALRDPQEVQSQVSELERSYSTLLGVTQNCESEILDRIDNRIFDFVKRFNDFESYVANNFQMVLERLDEQRMAETLDWISPVKERDRHDPTNTDRLPDTCEWLLQNPIFKEWDVNEEKATLWLQGTLGTGKTYLTSKVIEHLLRTTQPWEGLEYYYCKRTKGQGDEKPEDVIRSLFRQLAAPPADQSFKISKDVQTLFLEMNYKASSPEISICREKLLKLVNEYSRTTIVLDALDECDKLTRRSLFDAIDRLQSHSKKPIRVFFSARPDKDIIKRFGDHSTIKTGITNVNNDIKLLIQEKVKLFQCWEDMSEGDRKEIVDKLLEKGAGMFQLVNLQIRSLMDCGLKQDVFAQLEKMPEDLTEAYEEIYDKLSQKLFQKQLVDRAFMWVMCAYEPLTTDLLLAAIRLDGEKDERQEKITKDILLGLCNNLLVCNAHEDSDIWVFSHASVVEFIEEKLWHLSEAHCYAAKVCLRFLMHVYGELTSNTPTTRNNDNRITSTRGHHQEILEINHEFHRYCQHHWVRHIQYHELSPPNDVPKFDIQLRSLLQRFLGSPSQGGPAYQGWYQDIPGKGWVDDPSSFILWTERGYEDLSPPILPVLAMSRFSFDGILSDWWDSYEISSSHINDQHEAPLTLAARAGCSSICERLVTKGAFLNQCGNEFSALSAAAYGGHDEIVRLLLDHGASVDLIIQGDCGSALAAAAYSGQDKTVQLLLDCGASVDLLLPGYYGSALVAAAWCDQDKIVQLLLDRGASVDMLLPGYYGSALVAAISCSNEKRITHGNNKIVQLLLDRGASVDLLLPGDYGSALAAAAWYSQDWIVQLLLDRGASVDLLLPGDYGSALAAAAGAGQVKIVQLLLDSKASVDLPLPGDYGSALAAAAWCGQDKTVQLLLDRKASVDLLLPGYYGSALAAAAWCGQGKTVQLLVDNGASVDLLLQSGFYGSSLAAAAATGHASVVKYFIEQCNADVNLTLTTGRHGTALNAACYWGQVDCVKILLDAGAIVDLSLTSQSFSSAFLASEEVVGNHSYESAEWQCWRGRTEGKLADDKKEVTRILHESVASKAIVEIE